MMSNSKFLNKTFKTNEGYNIKIIGMTDLKNVEVQFDDGMTRKGLDISNIVNGRVKNLNHRSSLGIGFVGYGKYSPSSIYYKTWDKMLRRCHDNNAIGNRISYTKATMCEEWENFQNFASWCESNYVENWTLDKDLLSTENKIYSPSTCCFLPNILNNMFCIPTKSGKSLPIGVMKYKDKYRVSMSKFGKPIYFGTFETVEGALEVYKKIKQEYIVEVANKYQKLLKENVYKALINFEIKEMYHHELYNDKNKTI